MYQQITATAAPGRGRPDALAIFVTPATQAPPVGRRSLDRALDGRIGDAMRRPEFSAEAGACTTVHATDADARAKRVVIVGLGAADALTPRTVCLAGAALARALGGAQVKRVRLEPGGLTEAGVSPADAGAWLGHGLSSANFAFDSFRGAAGDKPSKPMPRLSVHVPKPMHRPLADALVAGQAANNARLLGATPPNAAHPAYLAAHCRKLARRTGLTCKVIDVKQAKRLGMGGLLAVGQGGSTPPCMIVLEHKGSPASTGAAKQDPILVVGKAITFDTGGYSLKISGGMKGMKYDKCGGCAVIGIMEAVARLKLKQRVVGLIACAENMIDTHAYRVDDIITISNGVTVEVTNTDAEGRLVLADALAYGTKTYQPKAVFDLATLTGGVVVALGNQVAGAWCNDDALWSRVEKASAGAAERAWRMPLDAGYRKMMKAQHADLHNSAPVRAAHPIQGAAFLSYFVGEEAPTQMPTIPWCHLDIAGVATTDEATALHDKGPTGYGVRLVTGVIRRW